MGLSFAKIEFQILYEDFASLLSSVIVGGVSGQNVKQAGAELCQAQHSLSLELDTH